MRCLRASRAGAHARPANVLFTSLTYGNAIPKELQGSTVRNSSIRIISREHARFTSEIEHVEIAN